MAKKGNKKAAKKLKSTPYQPLTGKLNKKKGDRVKFPTYAVHGNDENLPEVMEGVIDELVYEAMGYNIIPDEKFTETDTIFRSDSELIDE